MPPPFGLFAMIAELLTPEAPTTSTGTEKGMGPEMADLAGWMRRRQGTA